MQLNPFPDLTSHRPLAASVTNQPTYHPEQATSASNLSHFNHSQRTPVAYPALSSPTTARNLYDTPVFHPNAQYQPGSTPREDELAIISNALLEQQFMEMDRVITFDEADWALDMGRWAGLNQ